MKGLLVRGIAVAVLVGGSAACTQNADVGVTKSESLVAGCEKLGEVSASPSTPDADVDMVLGNEARAKGGNYVLVPSDGARTGSAYRCQVPSTASR